MLQRRVEDRDSGWLGALIRNVVLALICIVALAIRLFSVVKWEAVIHEFDPQFNRFATHVLAHEGFHAFRNFFDSRAWYPLGRSVGGTIYPGLMATAAGIQWLLNWLNIPLDTRNTCVFTAPLFAGLTALMTFLMTKEVSGRASAGLIAAAMVAVVPSYISRSVGGSFDNEGVAIFALVQCFYTWVRAVRTGSMAWAAGAALAYFYMVASWGGYVFVINMIPIYVVVMVLCGRYSSRLYVAYSAFYVLGSLLAMQVPFVGFNVLLQAECAASHGVFLLVQVLELANFVRWHLGDERFRRYARAAVLVAGGAVVVAASAALLWMQLTGRLGWTGRSLSLLDPTYAARFIPIIASVSEHQPTAWTSFFFDLHAATVLAPVGLYVLSQRVDDGKVFLLLYGTISWYFAGVMVRLMLTLAPAACMLAGIGAHALLSTFAAHAKQSLAALWPLAPLNATGGLRDQGCVEQPSSPSRAGAEDKDAGAGASEGQAALPTVAEAATLPLPLSLAGMAVVSGLLVMFAFHATHVASEAYSSPSIVLASQGADGSRVVLDDYREAYYWLRMNTADDAKVMSWWDYGYQIGTLGNRTTIVDNNTWNTTSLATVGRALARPEEEAYPILRSLDVDYVVVVFGGLTGYQSDDIAKLLWPVRISGNEFPHIKESQYYVGGQFRLDADGSRDLLNSLLYKMCYYRFGEVRTGPGQPPGFDRARNVVAGHTDFEFEHLEEAFTSEHWIVRVYKVKIPSSLQPLPSAPSVVRAKRLSTWPQSAQAKSPRGKASGPRSRGPPARFLGCWADENDFLGRSYVGGGSGAQLGLAKAAALQARTKYLAIARAGDAGHSFAFRRLQGRPIRAGDSGCSNPCLDDPQQPCGCADAACGQDKLPGQEHNRRWAVYELQPEIEQPGRSKAS